MKSLTQAMAFGALMLFVTSHTMAQRYAPVTIYGDPVFIGPTTPRIVQMTPWGPYDLLGGYLRPRGYISSPTGHRITPQGPNGYIYEPVYDQPGVSTATPAYNIPSATLPSTTAAPSVAAPSVAAPAVAAPAVAAPAVAAPAVSVARPVAIPPANVPQSNGPRPIDEALRAFQAGRFAEVVERCELMTLDQPRDGFAHVLESHALFALGRYDESAAALSRGLSVLPEEQWAWLIGQYRAFYPPSSYTGLLEKLEKQVADQPRNAASQRLLGYHAGMLGQTQSALEHLRAAVTLEPSDELSPRLMRRWSSAAR